ncbi:MAG TPA: ATP synthase F1 subunit delta [Vicinamibacterales bacterium]|jgi:F-type H+-transporting ATPase subunit delta|nr:ATP synthase F1 subunit delta [Vicinamibacterales bacterium]
MSRRATGAREARALLEVAVRESDPDRVGDELDIVAEAMRTQRDVEALLLHPGITVPRKVEAVQALAARLGFTPVVSRLLVVLVERDRLRIVPELAAAYRTRLYERRNVVAADITTAVPLERAAVDRVGRALEEVSGKQVILSARVDPSIIGGVVARVGSTVYDGSVTTQLALMRRKLVENV